MTAAAASPNSLYSAHLARRPVAAVELGTVDECGVESHRGPPDRGREPARSPVLILGTNGRSPKGHRRRLCLFLTFALLCNGSLTSSYLGQSASMSVAAGGSHPQPDTGADRPVALVALPHPHGRRPRRGLDPRRAGDHRRRRRRRPADQAGGARHQLDPGGPHRHGVPGRRGRRRALLRVAVRQAGPQEAVHHHARRLPDRQWADGVHAEQRRRLAGLPVRHPLHQRDGHRRRVRGDQLRDRRADPRALPRPRRHHGQRHLLGRRHHRHPGHVHLPQPAQPEHRLAGRVPARPGARPGHHLRAPEPAGEPPLAGHARARPRGREDDRLHRARGGAAAVHAAAGARGARRSRSSPPRTSATSRWPACCSRSTRSGRSTAPR